MGTRRPDSVESTGSPESGSRPPERISCCGWGICSCPGREGASFPLPEGRMEGAAAAAPVAHQAGGQDLGLDAGNDAGPELSDGREADAIFIAEREIVEQVFEGLYALLFQERAAAGTDAGQGR